MTDRPLGTLSLHSDRWLLEAEPHVIQMARRIWKRGGRFVGQMRLEATPAIAVDLEWFRSRYPLEISEEDRKALEYAAQNHQERCRRVQDYLGRHLPPPPFDLALPPRDYQAREGAIILEQGHLLIADVVGLGKSASAITVMTRPEALPAVVVTLTHLPQQWAREIAKFAPRLRTHVLRNGPLYALDGSDGRQQSLDGSAPDVVVTSYSKLDKWAPVLLEYARYVVFDEIQELRRDESARYAAAQAIAAGRDVRFRAGLTATPIYNYGDEIFNVLTVLAPGRLGTKSEFRSEWCIEYGQHHKIRHPEAFGSWARSEGLVVRHTRQEVGRELPEVISVVQEIGAEAKALNDIEGRAGELARILLDGAKREKGEALMAGGELDRIVRQATGLAKAPYVADFVRLLVESGEQVLLAGWHHAVYDLWEERLAGIRVGRYTGKETGPQKDAAAEDFRAGRSAVLMISLRSGVGLEGLQEAARVVVFGELDWSPAIHEQVIGRLRRDGQADPVLAYYLVADSGADPIMAQVLGIKRNQASGILDPGAPAEELFRGTDLDRTRRLAEEWLRRNAA